MPNGNHGMDSSTATTAAITATVTAVVQWLWRRLVTTPRMRPLSVREMKDLIDTALSQHSREHEQKIDRALSSIEELRTEIGLIRGTTNGLAERFSRWQAQIGGD